MVLQPCEQELQPPTQGVNRAEPRVAERGWRYPVDVTDAPAPTPPVANARRRVPRWVWFVVVCVALGAMTSVGVAWGIAWRGDSEELRLIGMRAGMKTLRLAGARKIAAGLTTLEEVLRVAPMDNSRDGA